MSSFTLRLKDAKTLREGTLTTTSTTTVFELKAELMKSGFAVHGTRLHVAHGGRLLTDAETLENVQHIPTVVVVSISPTAASAPPAPTATAAHAAPSPELQHPREPTRVMPAGMGTVLQHPILSREAIDRAWERAFPAPRHMLPNAPSETQAASTDAPSDALARSPHRACIHPSLQHPISSRPSQRLRIDLFFPAAGWRDVVPCLL